MAMITCSQNVMPRGAYPLDTATFARGMVAPHKIPISKRMETKNTGWVFTDIETGLNGNFEGVEFSDIIYNSPDIEIEWKLHFKFN